jgi:hypothetical protein
MPLSLQVLGQGTSVMTCGFPYSGEADARAMLKMAGGPGNITQPKQKRM